MNALCSAFLLASLIISSSAPAQSVHVQKGLELFGQQRYGEALQEFEAARSLSPENPAIENALGITKTKLGKVPEANQHYLNAIRWNPKFEDAHKNLGFNFLGAGQYAPAERELRTAVALAPDDPFAHFYLAMLYLATSRDREVTDEVQPSRPVLGSDPTVSYQIAKACLRADQIEKAMSIITLLQGQKSISLSQGREFAISLFEKSAYREAAALYRSLLAAEPKSWEDRYNLAVALLNSDQTPEATKILELLESERRSDVKVVSVLGSVYEAARKMPEALEAYKAEISIEPQEGDRYLDYTRVLMDLNRYQMAEQVIQQGLKVVREPYPLYMRLGAIRMMGGKVDEAREYFEKAITERPEIPVGYVAVAQSFFKERQDEKAASVLEKARQRIPSDYLLDYYYGLALDRLGRKDEAAHAIEQALALNSTVPDIHFELGRVYFDLNRMDSAQMEFQQVIKMNPRHSKAYFQLSRIYARLGDAEKAHQYAEETRRLKQAEREGPELPPKSMQPIRPQ
jgi:tetratricopeptide (TPR) repeat protein